MWLSLETFLDGLEEDSLLFTRRSIEDVYIFFCFTPEYDEECRISSIIEDHIRCPTIMPLEYLMSIVPVLFEGFSFSCKYRNSSSYDCCGSMILCGKYITARPSHLCAECGKCFDKYSSLDGHME